jgi:hypothetical protein
MRLKICSTRFPCGTALQEAMLIDIAHLMYNSLVNVSTTQRSSVEPLWSYELI